MCGRTGNRLVNSPSPYLLQHAHNPVEWWPWCPEALAEAKKLDKAIFLSVGYSACHWCHVMERESFENERIAALLNANFICIKVDREQHPDIDETYMLATQLLTGAGGWPMSVWLTPDLKPFYAGTYFPPQDMYNRPGFARLLSTLAEAFTNQRSQVEMKADEIAEAIRKHVHATADTPSPVNTGKWLGNAISADQSRFDYEYGASRGSPKFPPHQALNLWLTFLEKSADGELPAKVQLPASLSAQVGRMLAITLDQMARGGIFDHLAGGFARYSTDEKWLVPHFEKMLYDNAQLAGIYARAGQRFGVALWSSTARRTLDLWLNSLTDHHGLFLSALDADSEGREGKYYIWSWKDFCQVVTDTADRDLLCRHFGITEEGNWESANVLYLAQDAVEIAQNSNATPPTIQVRIETLSRRMLAARQLRIAPAVDDKILTGWNGLMIAALCSSAAALHEPQYILAARRATDALLMLHRNAAGQLLHMSRAGTAVGPAYLEDYAFFLSGIIALADVLDPTDASAAEHYWHQATGLADDMIRNFLDADSAGFYSTSPQHDHLMVRLKPGMDNAIPSPNGIAVHALFTLAHRLNRPDYRLVATRTTEFFSDKVDQYPTAMSSLITALLTEACRPVVPAKVQPRVVQPAASAESSSAGEKDGTPSVLTLQLNSHAEKPIRLTHHSGTEFILEVNLELLIALGYYVDLTTGISQALAWKLMPEQGGHLLSVDVPAGTRVGSWPDAPIGLAGANVLTCRISLDFARVQRTGLLQLNLTASPCVTGACLPPRKVMVQLEYSDLAKP